MSGSILYFVVNGLNQVKTWLRSYSWIGATSCYAIYMLTLRGEYQQ